MTLGRGRASAATPPMPRSATRSSRGLAVEEVPYDAARDLRVAWHREDFPGVDLGGHVDDAREVAMRLGAHVLAVEEAGSTVGFAQFERQGQTARSPTCTCTPTTATPATERR